MTGRGRRRGFTLLEIILAMGLIVGLMGAVYGFYHQVGRIRRDAIARAEAITAQRAVMDFLTGELRSATVYPYLNLGLQYDGQTRELRFMTLSLPGPAAWAVRSSADEPIPPEHDIQWVGYRVRWAEDEDGQPVNLGLERTCQKVMAAETAEEADVMTVDAIAPSVRFFHVECFNGTDWVQEWTARDLPLAVRILLGTVDPGTPEMTAEEYLDTYPTATRVVYVPGSRLALQGFVRDGGGEDR